MLKLNCVEGKTNVTPTLINIDLIESIEERKAPEKGCIICMQGKGNVFYVEDSLIELYAYINKVKMYDAS